MSHFKKIARSVPLRQPSLMKGIEAAQMVEVCQKTIDQIFGDDAPQLRALTFKDGLLVVKCTRSVYAETLRLRSQELIEAINAELGREAVMRVTTK